MWDSRPSAGEIRRHGITGPGSEMLQLASPLSTGDDKPHIERRGDKIERPSTALLSTAALILHRFTGFDQD